MRSHIGAGIIAGLIAGVAFGLLMMMMTAPTPEGGRMPMMAMVAKIMDSTSLAVGWAYHLFNSAVIGAIFGWLLGRTIQGWGAGLGWGALYGASWWIVGGLILMPVFLGMPAFAPLLMPEMRPAGQPHGTSRVRADPGRRLRGLATPGGRRGGSGGAAYAPRGVT